jgi:hypothetical protein
MSTMLMAPFIYFAAAIDHPGWLAAYAVVCVALALLVLALAWLMSLCRD